MERERTDSDENADDVDAAITVGATTSSHPAEADDMDVNRSGSGGTGGAATDADTSEGGGQQD